MPCLYVLKGLALVAGPFAVWSLAQARTIEVGPGLAAASLAAVAGMLQDGDDIRILPGRYGSCAVLRAGNLTVEGIGDAASVVLDGGICQSKAIIVAAGHGLTLRNLTLANAKIAEGNAAGIRAESGALTVDGVRFTGDQNGILTNSTAPDMVLTVRHSLFVHDGACIAACAHGIYAGHIARLSVSASVFRGTQEGHAIKSRAARTEVTACDIADGPDGTGSYLIEAPNGGAVLITDNTLEKGAHAGNKAAIAIGMEGMDQPTPSLVVKGNRFTNDSARPMVFVRNGTPVAALLEGNLLNGPMTPLVGPGVVR